MLLLFSESRSPDLEKYGKGSWAIVTGSTDGIGKAFAESLASRGFNIYQISRNSEKLARCQEDLVAKYNVKVLSRTWNFLDCSDKLQEFIEAIQTDTSDKDISILINNVGHLKIGRFIESTPSEILESLAVNCLPVVYVTKLLYTKMNTRSRPSAVINLSSVLAYLPTPGFAMYSASKRFDDAFTINLTKESNIVVCSLKPGSTVSGITSKYRFVPLLISAKQCSEAALRDLGHSVPIEGHYLHKILGYLIYSMNEALLARILLVVCTMSKYYIINPN